MSQQHRRRHRHVTPARQDYEVCMNIARGNCNDTQGIEYGQVQISESTTTTTTTTTTTSVSRPFSQDNLGCWHQRGKPFWILLEQEMMGWQWHQLDHMQIICTSLQTDNHASTSPLSFYRLDALPAAKPTVSKH